MRRSSNNLPFSVILLAGIASACGYSATPITLSMTLAHVNGSAANTLALAGTSDPAASGFSDGLMLATRWSASIDGVPTVELWLDLDRSALPTTLALDAPPRPLTLDQGQVRARLAERAGDGSVRTAYDARAAEVVVVALGSDGQRTLSAGSFDLQWLAPTDGLYVSTTGIWETSPRPQSTSILPEPDGTAPTPDGSAPADPHGADGTTPPPVDPAGSDPVVVGFDASGCSCGTSDDGESLPDEGSDNSNTSSDSGGCDCTGEDSGNGNTSTNDNTSSDSGGCDCQGDSGPDNGNDNTGGNDNTSSSGGGCDCQGDSPEPAPGTTARLSSDPGPAGRICRAPTTKPAARRHGVCRSSPVKVAFETSPIFFLFFLGWRRRRWH